MVYYRRRLLAACLLPVRSARLVFTQPCCRFIAEHAFQRSLVWFNARRLRYPSTVLLQFLLAFHRLWFDLPSDARRWTYWFRYRLPLTRTCRTDFLRRTLCSPATCRLPQFQLRTPYWWERLDRRTSLATACPQLLPGLFLPIPHTRNANNLCGFVCQFALLP